MRTDWGFYGRKTELETLQRVLGRNRWFFLKIAGRRRIGKTSLVQQALQPSQRNRVLYIQVPDSDPAGVVSAARDFMQMFGITTELPTSLRALATRIGSLAESGWVIALDEFQYFNRKALYEFTSQLQAEVDRLTSKADQVRGGLIVLGSVHTEMTALLEDRQAPLFNRLTDDLEVGHLDIASILEMLSIHADTEPMRLLFLWNLFEGVPKFYRDCFEQGVLSGDRQPLLRQMFFSSSSPLRNEADNWFLRELRGRYDLVLKFIATHPGCSNADIVEYVKSVEPESEKQVGGYLKILDERFQMVERLQPIFAKSKARSGRFYIRDNFLRSWLAALAIPVASVAFRPTDELVGQADTRLADAEGYGLERLVATVYEERSRKGVGDFALTEVVRGWWDRNDTEIDLVALNSLEKTLRLGTCKRSADRLVTDLSTFDGHIDRFLTANPKYQHFKLERVAIAPVLEASHRREIARKGYLPQSLAELIEPLSPESSIVERAE
jgi:AAA+ ATPase superfamily predicted ATPase